jgi:hypothetical protein
MFTSRECTSITLTREDDHDSIRHKLTKFTTTVRFNMASGIAMADARRREQEAGARSKAVLGIHPQQLNNPPDIADAEFQRSQR